MKKLYISFYLVISCISPIFSYESAPEQSSFNTQQSIPQCSNERLEQLLTLQIQQQEELLKQSKQQNQLLNIIALPIVQREQRHKAIQEKAQSEQEEWDTMAWWQKAGSTTLDWTKKVLVFYWYQILLPDLINHAGHKANREILKLTDDGAAKLFGQNIRPGELLGYSSKSNRMHNDIIKKVFSAKYGEAPTDLHEFENQIRAGLSAKELVELYEKYKKTYPQEDQHRNTNAQEIPTDALITRASSN